MRRFVPLVPASPTPHPACHSTWRCQDNRVRRANGVRPSAFASHDPDGKVVRFPSNQCPMIDETRPRPHNGGAMWSVEFTRDGEVREVADLQAGLRIRVAARKTSSDATTLVGGLAGKRDRATLQTGQSAFAHPPDSATVNSFRRDINCTRSRGETSQLASGRCGARSAPWCSTIGAVELCFTE